jgi:hypothetical protein
MGVEHKLVESFLEELKLSTIEEKSCASEVEKDKEVYPNILENPVEQTTSSSVCLEAETGIKTKQDPLELSEIKIEYTDHNTRNELVFAGSHHVEIGAEEGNRDELVFAGSQHVEVGEGEGNTDELMFKTEQEPLELSETLSEIKIEYTDHNPRNDLVCAGSQRVEIGEGERNGMSLSLWEVMLKLERGKEMPCCQET